MTRRRNQTGYSLIEVMTAVVVMIVCSTGIAAMVNATTRANEDGWETSVATQFASTWLERVKRDALLWTSAGAPTATTYLNDLTGTWFVPTPPITAPQESWAADAFGYDTQVPGAMHFCVNLQNQVVHQLATGQPNAIRVNLRVFWNRSARGDTDVVNRMVGPITAADRCQTPLDVSGIDRNLVREIYVSTVVHWVPL